MNREFGYLRIASVSVQVRPADPIGNAERIADPIRRRLWDQDGVDVVLFPELCLTGYTCADLFLQPQLLRQAEAGLATVLAATAGSQTLYVVGLPVAVGDRIYNAAAVLQDGQVLGVVPKTFLPNAREYYETRWFAPGDETAEYSVRLCGQEIPFGTDLIFRARNVPEFVFAVEICEDLWAPTPPSSEKALQGALLILNPSASNALVGKHEYRRSLVLQQSARCQAAYAYASAGPGESTTDTLFGDVLMVAENGAMLREFQPWREGFACTCGAIADIDLQALQADRRASPTFRQAVDRLARRSASLPPRPVEFTARETQAPAPLLREIPAHPFVPADPATLDARCHEILDIQAAALETRLRHIGCTRVVLGLSGGLDSTLALLVVRRAFDRIGLPHANILAVTMPGFGTTKRTKNNATELAAAFGVTLQTIDIVPACRRHFQDIGHDPETHDVTYENVQARERTQILMDLANKSGGIVIGTGDLSEMALGWSTYNGDHMSMYAVNCGVPKTLVRHLVRWIAQQEDPKGAGKILLDILDTPVSPELMPHRDGEIVQKTEEIVGPYELHDFFLYATIRQGVPPRKLLYLASQAFGERYPETELCRWLKLFYRRFFANQFKRSCIPDGPKVGSVALSPRADWRMPSDASAAAWIAELE